MAAFLTVGVICEGTKGGSMSLKSEAVTIGGGNGIFGGLIPRQMRLLVKILLLWVSNKLL